MRRSSNGFTLVEVLVALAVLAIALPALMFNIAEQLSSLDYMRDKSMAHWVAMNKMTELRLQNDYVDYLPKDRQNGSTMLAGREWFWTVETEKTVSEIVLKVNIQVRETDDRDEPALVTLSNYFQLPIDTRITTP